MPLGAWAFGPEFRPKDCVIPLERPTQNEDGTRLTDFDHFLVMFSRTPDASGSEGAQMLRVEGDQSEVRCPVRVRNTPGQYYVRAVAVDHGGRSSQLSPLVPFMVIK